MVDFYPSKDHVLILWHVIKPHLFPLLPKTTESFISLMFWHSFLTTASGTRRWIEQGFGLHAFFSLLWLVIAYIQIVHSRKFQTKLHQYLGMLSIVGFIGYSIAGLQTFYFDIGRHKTVVKLMFIAVVLDHCCQFFRAVYYATKGGPNWYMLHQDEMVILFLGSIGGTGPIRAIAEIQTLLGFGTAICEARYTGMASNCQLEYMNRLALVGLWCYYMKGVYVAMRNNKSLTKDYAAKAFSFVCVMVFVIAFSYVPFAGNILTFLFGEPQSFQGSCVTLLGTIWLVKRELCGLQRFCVQRNKAIERMLAKAA